MLFPFRLTPIYRDYVWGGKRLRPEAEITAEAWIIYDGNKVADGLFAGEMLAQVAEREGAALLGNKVAALTGNRFPLLIKLLDCASWLSLQVHPNNEQAEQLEGIGHFGKTEAWYLIQADKGAELISGFQAGVTRADIQKSVGRKEILDLVNRQPVKTGDTIFIEPGTVHALGPGLLLYEIQQNSDITYRVYDWDRPMTEGRKLHIQESISVLNPDARGNFISTDEIPKVSGKKELVSCKYFTLDLVDSVSGQAAVNLRGESFSTVTALQDSIKVHGENWIFELHALESLFIPAIQGMYWVEGASTATALVAHAGSSLQ